jgi:hypothetical protein
MVLIPKNPLNENERKSKDSLRTETFYNRTFSMSLSYITLLYFFETVNADFGFAVRYRLMYVNASTATVFRLQATARLTERPENAP